MADGCQLDFKRWVPEAAKSELQRLADEPGANYPLLKRLASYEVMREVWKKLPAAARGKEDLIVRQTDAVARIVEAWQKLEFFRKHSSLQSAKKAARFASKLLDAMEQTSGDASDLWQSLCLVTGGSVLKLRCWLSNNWRRSTKLQMLDTKGS